MGYIIGSARIDERGRLSGGKRGDQKQTTTPDYKGEVSLQSFYVHKKGWVVLRPRDKRTARKIAEGMKIACNNPNIGYDQGRRAEVVVYGIQTTKPCGADCSSLVRAVIYWASGVDVGNFTTATEVSTLLYSKIFDRLAYSPDMALMEGDVLVTKTKGHTVIVTDAQVDRPTLKKGSKGGWVKELQTLLNYSGIGCLLAVDGIFGPLTQIAVISYQKMHGLKGDGIVGPKTWKELYNE